MIIFDYLYYALYCLTTINRNPEGAESRAMGAFAITFAINFFNIQNILAAYFIINEREYVAIKFLLCIAFCIAYLAYNRRAYRLPDFFQNKYGNNNKLHAILGAIYFWSSIILFTYTATCLKKID